MTKIRKDHFIVLYWATKIVGSQQPMTVAEEMTETLMAMVKLCQKAIEDHYMLPISDQPYNE